MKGVFVIIGLTLSLLLQLISNVDCTTGRFSALEEQALKTFRPMVTDTLYRDYMHNDWYLIFWLRGANMDMTKAEKMLRTTHQWRKEKNVDSLISQDFSKLERDLPYYLDGHDREGRPISSLLMGTWNMRKLALAGQRDQFLLYLNRMNEIVGKMARDTWNSTTEMRVTRDVPDWILIGNLQGYTAKEQGCIACIPAYLSYSTDWDLYYPDMTSIYVVNTPRLFETILTLVRRILSHKTNNALKVYGMDKEEWSAALHKVIHPDQLRPAFGGTKRS